MEKQSFAKLVKSLDTIIYYGFVGLIFSVPLTFLTINKEWFAIPKITLLQIGTIFLLACWFTKQLFSEQVEFKLTKLDFFILFFLASAAISTLFSVHPITSLLGKYGRYEGLITLVNYGLLFFLASQTFLDWKRVCTLCDAVALSASLVALYGLFQYLGWDIIPKSQFWEPNRSFSTLGNPVLLSGYLALVLPLILSRYLESSNKKLVLYGGAFLLTFASLITTFSRGGWLAGLAGLMALVLFLKRQILRKETKYLFIVLICAFFLVLASNYFKVSTAPQENISLVERVRSVPKIREGSLAARFLIWQGTLKMIVKRPFLGWGPDTLHLIYPSFTPQKLFLLEGASVRADNAHNYFLQLAATQGILGLLAFLVLLGFFFWEGFRSLFRSSRVYSLPAGLLAGVVGYVVYLQSGINTVESGVIFWTLLAIVSLQVAPADRWIRIRFSSLTKFATLPVLFILVMAGFYFSVRPLLADIYFAQSEKAEREGYFYLAIENGTSATRLNPYQDRYLRHIGRLYSLSSEQSSWNKALQVYLEAKRINPLELDNCGRIAELYLKRALEGEPVYYARAEKELRFLLRRSPYMAVAHSGLGFIYLATGRFEQAVRHLENAIMLDRRDAQAHLFLGMSLEALNKKEQAVIAYKKTLRLNPKNKEAKEALERLLARQKVL